MIINKIQGQTLGHASLYLPMPIFIHGQLHVAVSHVKTQAGLEILITYDSDKKIQKLYDLSLLAWCLFFFFVHWHGVLKYAKATNYIGRMFDRML
jgi:hypothetical protein